MLLLYLPEMQNLLFYHSEMGRRQALSLLRALPHTRAKGSRRNRRVGLAGGEAGFFSRKGRNTGSGS